MLIVIAFASGIISLLLSNVFFAGSGAKNQKVETIDSITSDFKLPNKKYFNKDAVDPALLVQVAPNDNQNPFSTSH